MFVFGDVGVPVKLNRWELGLGLTTWFGDGWQHLHRGYVTVSWVAVKITLDGRELKNIYTLSKLVAAFKLTRVLSAQRVCTGNVPFVYRQRSVTMDKKCQMVVS